MVIYRELSKSGDKRCKLVTDWSWIGHGLAYMFYAGRRRRTAGTWLLSGGLSSFLGFGNDLFSRETRQIGTAKAKE